ERRCPECGFEAGVIDVTAVGDLVRDNAAAWQALLARPAGELARRPSEDRWSALEYACHVRDVLVLYDERLHLMLTEDDPDFANWDQDVAAIEGRYAEQDPARVAADIAAGAAVIAERFDGVPEGAWGRTGNRSDGAQFTIESFARYFIHDPVHHVDDVEKGFAMLQAGGHDG
ncbi:MAG TPA: DinB family protein, partial [Acidimicrobiales bacterium]